MEDLRVDTSDPLYIHPSDHPGLVLVTPSFDGRNFGEWRRSMRIALSAKNKIGFVLGTIEKPPESSLKFRSWERCNDMVISWLINGLSAEIKRSVIYTESAQEIWEQLDARYGSPGATQLYTVQKDINTLSQGTKSFPVFFTEMKSLWDELDSLRKFPSCRCGAVKELVKYEQDQRVLQLLMGLNESFCSLPSSSSSNCRCKQPWIRSIRTNHSLQALTLIPWWISSSHLFIILDLPRLLPASSSSPRRHRMSAVVEQLWKLVP